jgi:3-oxoacyl-[acyl-carrier protein] reductase
LVAGCQIKVCVIKGWYNGICWFKLAESMRRYVMIDPNLKDKVVLITGANHGIGAATARTFASQGAKVFITYYRDSSDMSQGELERARSDGKGGPLLYSAVQQQTGEAVVAQIRAAGGMAAAFEADLAAAGNIPVLFDRCEQTLGPVDILVNNHTYCVLETFDPARITPADVDPHDVFPIRLPAAEIIDAHFVINTRAYALLMSEYFQRALRRDCNWGRVINLSTDAAHAHEANVSYAASKHAIESYSRSAAVEMGKYGITVNIVAPGPVQTGYITPQSEIEIAKGTPLGRVGWPEDVADVIVFLASEQARWLTGQLLYVGGGWRMSQ